jgi:hypothetical protein
MRKEEKLKRSVDQGRPVPKKDSAASVKLAAPST